MRTVKSETGAATARGQKYVSIVVGGSATYLVTLDAQNMGIWFLAYNSTIF